uniref:Uncharacterized protein n=1 Tax=Taenioma perpusillum TaxID=210852 RepID=A0A1Z1MRJ2_9FLOR|nr:hypothetical protein [Taenioma perpusillum]ARW68489.1 hypothetical protein [Taenioma perpusillum]
MSLSHLSLYRQYLQSPYTIFHEIKINIKLMTVFIILLSLPYINTSQLISLFFILLLKCILFFYISKKKKSWHKKKIFFILLLYYILNSLYFKKYIYQYIKNYKKFFIITFFSKLILIHLIYFIIISILHLTTSYEYTLLYISKIIHSVFNYLFKDNYLITLLLYSSQLLERIIFNLNLVYTISKIKHYNIIQSKYMIYIIYKVIYHFMISTFNEIIYISKILWNRGLDIKINNLNNLV